MDIRPPVPRSPKDPRRQRPVVPYTPAPQPLPVAPAEEHLQTIQLNDPQTDLGKQKTKRPKKLWKIILSIFVVLVVAVGVAGVLWYQRSLSPVSDDESQLVSVTIESGSSPSMIANQLEAEGLVRNAYAFRIHAKVTNTENFLQAGAYRLSPAYSTPEIIEHLTNGKTDTFDITFLPGATLADNKKVLLAAGFSESAVDTAFAATYDSPLFAGKPASADLEGYIYGETYRFNANVTVNEILAHSFDAYYTVIEQNDLVAKFDAQGLSLFQGITLASIIQRESGGDDKAQIASVFYNRLAIGMELGSDVTYQYIADKEGVARDTNLDSPYNTRRYAGLPPGPIAAPGVESLIAVGQPASTDYLFFLSGDDNVTYYGRTIEEHEQNIANHCQAKCQII